MSIEVEKSTMRPPICSVSACFGLGSVFQGTQMAGPETVEEIAHGLQSACAHDEQVARSLVSLGDEASPAQHAQVKRDRLLGQRDLLGDLSDGAGLVAHDGEDAAAVGVGQGAQCHVEGLLGCGSGHVSIQP
jgi:hypothetical protein